MAACAEALTVLAIKACQFGTIQIKDTEQAPVLQQGHHNLGARRGVAGDMPRKCIDIGNHERLSALRSGAADAAAEGNPHAGNLALERSENQLVALEKIKPDPVQFGQSMVEHRAHIRRVGETIGFTGEKPSELSVQFLV